MGRGRFFLGTPRRGGGLGDSEVGNTPRHFLAHLGVIGFMLGIDVVPPRRGSARLGVGGMGLGYSEAMPVGVVMDMASTRLDVGRRGTSRVGVGWLSGGMLGKGFESVWELVEVDSVAPRREVTPLGIGEVSVGK
ncbi:hypothetical protein PIB30_094841 [Stylosanthes scabra]|uniref:Uncharacterized protein n=1 Tax=Stylosanthes scabra TaxID=79078 RepID=A0ABU6UUD8_9FABA|nr:hypothetical protein [Stylosanthes scabra]